VLKNKKSSITDVANKAGVSIATVSRFFNSADQVSPDTRIKIAAAIEELNYRSIQQGAVRSNLIACVGRDLSNPNYITFFQTAEQLTDERGYILAYHNTDMSTERERKLFEHFAERNVAGVIAFTTAEDNDNISILEKRGIPIVLMDSGNSGNNSNVLANLVTNVYSGTYKGTQYLLSIGHRRIAFLAGNINLYTGATRLQGYLDALRDFDPNLQPLYYSVAISEDAGYAQTVQLLLQNAGVTAIFPASNQLTSGCFRALQEYNIRIPEQISLLGFDDIGHPEFYNPPLTVVSRPFLHRAGYAAMSILLNHIEQKDNSDTLAKVSIDMPMEILVRQSCAPPGK